MTPGGGGLPKTRAAAPLLRLLLTHNPGTLPYGPGSGPCDSPESVSDSESRYALAGSATRIIAEYR